ncbi:MAG: hypothetical protein SF097_09230 [Acidobacteriota bacterium]|nr:hypothetical protein [Acidobacteriota bacterium]
MQVIQPEFNELQRQVSDMRERLSTAEGQILQLNRASSDTSRQTIWQFVIFTITMGAILLGGLNYQTNALRNEFNARFDKIETQINSVEKSLGQTERNLNARFEDLKQEVRSRK